MKILIVAMLLVGSAAAGDGWNPEGNKAIDAYNAAIDADNAGQNKAAEARLRKCLKLEPDAGVCAVLLGRVLVRLGRADEGIELLRATAAAHPTNTAPLAFLAYALF